MPRTRSRINPIGGSPRPESVRGPTPVAGSVVQPAPPPPLDRLTHQVQYAADYPYGDLRLKPWTEPLALISRFLSTEKLEEITDEAELQGMFVEAIIDSHMSLSDGPSALIRHRGRQCTVKPIERRPVNLRTLFGPDAWDASPYVQEVRRRRTTAAEAGGDGQSTTTSLAQGAIKPDAAIVLTLKPVSQVPGSRSHSFPVLIGENKFSLAEWQYECSGRGPAEAAARTRLGLVYASRECLFQAAEYLVLAGEMGGARYGLAIANAHFYRMYRKANGVIAIEVPEGQQLARLLTVDQLRAHLDRWLLPPNKLVNIASREVDGLGLARFSAFVYAACQLVGTGRFIYDLACGRSAGVDPVFGATPVIGFRGTAMGAAAAHDQRNALHKLAENAKKRKASEQPVDPAGPVTRRRSRTPEDEGGAAGPSRDAGRGAIQPSRSSKRRRAAQGAPAHGNNQSRPGQQGAAGQRAATTTASAAHLLGTSTPSPPTEAAIKALQTSSPPEDLPAAVLAWAATLAEQPAGHETVDDVVDTAHAKALAAEDDLVDLGESYKGADRSVSSMRHLQDAGVMFEAVSTAEMERIALPLGDPLSTPSGAMLIPALSPTTPLLVRSAPVSRAGTPIMRAGSGRFWDDTASNDDVSELSWHSGPPAAAC